MQDQDARYALDAAFFPWRSQQCLCGDLRPAHADKVIGGTLLVGHGACGECDCQGFHVDMYRRQRPAVLAHAGQQESTGPEGRGPETEPP